MTNSIKAQIMFCEKINNNLPNSNQGTQIVNPFLGMFLPYIPSAASFGVVIIIYAEEAMNNAMFELRITYSTNSEVIFSTGSTSFEIPHESKINLNLSVELHNVAMPGAGLYKAEFLINGTPIVDQEFTVHKTEETPT